MVTPYPTWLNPGDNAWQLTAATLVGLMSVPGLVVLYGGVMQKRWAINSMMLTFVTFAIVLIVWVLWAFKMGFGHPITPPTVAPSQATSRTSVRSSLCLAAITAAAMSRGSPGPTPAIQLMAAAIARPA